MTKQLTQFTKANVQEISNEMDEAFANIAKKHGIALTVDSMRFSGVGFTSKISGKIMADSLTMLRVGSNVSVELARIITSKGLVASKDGRMLVDYKARNRKYPYIYTEEGTRYKCSEAQALFFFGA